MHIFSTADFLAASFPSEPIISEGILDAQGVMVVFGPSEVGKSYFVLQTALTLATGGAWLDRWSVTRPFRVLLLQAEVSAHRFQARVHKLSQSFAPSDKLWLATEWSLKLDERQPRQALVSALQDYQIEVLILDPFRPFFSGDENNSRDIEAFFSGFGDVRDLGIATIVVHHKRKPTAFFGTADEGKYTARGSSVITDRPDTILWLEPHKKNSDTIFMHWEKLRNADEKKKPEPLHLRVDPESGLFVPISADVEADRLPASTVLGAIPRGWTPLGDIVDQLAAQLSLSAKTVERRCNGLVGSGMIERRRHPEDARKVQVRRLS